MHHVSPASLRLSLSGHRVDHRSVRLTLLCLPTPHTSDRFRENVQAERDCAHGSLYIGTGIEKQCPCSLETLKLTEADWSNISCTAPEHKCCSPCLQPLLELGSRAPTVHFFVRLELQARRQHPWDPVKTCTPCFAIAVMVRSLFWLQKQFIPDESMFILAHCTFWWQAVSTL